jgi:fused
MAADEKGATALRSDPGFLDNLLKVLETNLNEIVRVKEKRGLLQGGLRALTQVLMKSKPPESRKFDNSKNLNIPNHLLALLKGLLRVDGGKQFVELASDITKLIGLLSRSSFHKNFGIEMVYVRSFVPLMPLLVRTAVVSNEAAHQTFTVNLLRTTGIFANNASANHIRSFSFYKDLVEKRFIQECMEIPRTYEDQLAVLKLFVQVLSAFMHPVYGDIECFPWRRDSAPGLQEYKECATMLECVRQTVINSLLETDCAPLFRKILALNDDAALLPKISVSRITLQAIRQSKEFTEHVLFQEKHLAKELLLSLNSSDQVVFGTACQIAAQMARYAKEKKKEKQLESALLPYLPVLLAKAKEGSKGLLNTFGAVLVLQELLTIEGPAFFPRILEEFEGDSSYYRALAELVSNPHINKLEEMRKIEGSNYGVHLVGLYDPAFLFLHRLLLRLQRENPKKGEDVLRRVRESKMPARISQLLVNLSSKSDLSPRGLISLLMLLYDLLSASICDEFADEAFLQALIGLLGEEQVGSLEEWPVGLGGGEVVVALCRCASAPCSATL